MTPHRLLVVALAVLLPAAAGAQRDTTYRSDVAGFSIRYPRRWRSTQAVTDSALTAIGNELAGLRAKRPGTIVPVAFPVLQASGDSVALPPSADNAETRYAAPGVQCLAYDAGNTPAQLLGLIVTVFRHEPGARVEGPSPWRARGIDGQAIVVTTRDGGGLRIVAFTRGAFTTSCGTTFTRETGGEAARVVLSLRAVP